MSLDVINTSYPHMRIAQHFHVAYGDVLLVAWWLRNDGSVSLKNRHVADALDRLSDDMFDDDFDDMLSAMKLAASVHDWQKKGCPGVFRA